METIKDPALKAFERWRTVVEEVVGTGNASYGVSAMVANDKPTYARMFMLGRPTAETDLAGNECAINVSFQCESFSTQGINKLYEIDDASHQAMVDMGFYRTYGGDIVDEGDSSIKRMVSRYSRLYMGSYLNEEEEQN